MIRFQYEVLYGLLRGEDCAPEVADAVRAALAEIERLQDAICQEIERLEQLTTALTAARSGLTHALTPPADSPTPACD